MRKYLSLSTLMVLSGLCLNLNLISAQEPPKEGDKKEEVKKDEKKPADKKDDKKPAEKKDDKKADPKAELKAKAESLSKSFESLEIVGVKADIKLFSYVVGIDAATVTVKTPGVRAYAAQFTSPQLGEVNLGKLTAYMGPQGSSQVFVGQGKGLGLAVTKEPHCVVFFPTEGDPELLEVGGVNNGGTVYYTIAAPGTGVIAIFPKAAAPVVPKKK